MPHGRVLTGLDILPCSPLDVFLQGLFSESVLVLIYRGSKFLQFLSRSVSSMLCAGLPSDLLVVLQSVQSAVSLPDGDGVKRRQVCIVPSFATRKNSCATCLGLMWTSESGRSMSKKGEYCPFVDVLFSYLAHFPTSIMKKLPFFSNWSIPLLVSKRVQRSFWLSNTEPNEFLRAS